MLTTVVDLTGVRGDTLLRSFALTRDGEPLSVPNAEEMATRFTGIVSVRAKPDDPVPLATGAVRFITTNPPQLVIEVPATDMQDVVKGFYDVQLTEARPGNPAGDLVWTIIAGRLNLRKDVVRDGA